MVFLQKGDWVKRGRHFRDCIFQVEKIHHGFAVIRHQSLPLTTVEPVRDLIQIKKRGPAGDGGEGLQEKLFFIKRRSSKSSKEY